MRQITAHWLGHGHCGSQSGRRGGAVNPRSGSIGNFYWTSAWGTTFWVDPKERLIAIQMIQTPTGLNSAYRHAFRNLTYAAMTGSEPAR